MKSHRKNCFTITIKLINVTAKPENLTFRFVLIIFAGPFKIDDRINYPIKALFSNRLLQSITYFQVTHYTKPRFTRLIKSPPNHPAIARLPLNRLVWHFVRASLGTLKFNNSVPRKNRVFPTQRWRPLARRLIYMRISHGSRRASE